MSNQDPLQDQASAVIRSKIDCFEVTKAFARKMKIKSEIPTGLTSSMKCPNPIQFHMFKSETLIRVAIQSLCVGCLFYHKCISEERGVGEKREGV